MSTLLRLLEPSSSTAANTSSQESSKPIILIVDEFDLFALHPRQSFLYCLLDIVQGNRRRGGVGVVGVSSRVVSFIVLSHFLACSLTDLYLVNSTGLSLAAREASPISLSISRPSDDAAFVLHRFHRSRSTTSLDRSKVMGTRQRFSSWHLGKRMECRGREVPGRQESQGVLRRCLAIGRQRSNRVEKHSRESQALTSLLASDDLILSLLSFTQTDPLLVPFGL